MKPSLGAKLLFSALLILTSAALLFAEFQYGEIWGYRLCLINCAFFLVFLIADRYGKRLGRARPLLLIPYLLFWLLFCLSLPKQTYSQAVEQIRQAEEISLSVGTLSPRHNKCKFVGQTTSGILPSGYYVVIFEDRPEFLYYMDPYTGEYGCVQTEPTK